MRTIVLASWLLLVLLAAPAAAEPVIVNGLPLDAAIRQALEARYGALVSGRYWYDGYSGLWGLEGGPSRGQIIPGLRLGRLAPDASVRSIWLKTFVFVNGREIHPQEFAALQRLFGRVEPGRYWLSPQGVAGYEGGPAQFDLRAAAMARSPPRGGAYTRNGAFGNTGSDGSCGYYNDVESGASVMVGDC
jgi:hypothetical protein